jgi:UDP-N-acetylglucosamine 2-epimerase
LAGALVAATNYFRSAHIEGGEVSGTIDEVFRHCNSKLCTHHFVRLKRHISGDNVNDHVGSPGWIPPRF